MRYGSVCSGIEAATVAWHPLGWKPAFFSEIEPFPRAVLQHHYPDTPLHGDFTNIEPGQYATIDLLVGGTPCQDFSVAGLRAGIAGDRGRLTVEYCNLAGRLRPQWLVWENVPGVLSADDGNAFGIFLGALAELGYGTAYRVLDAQYFGVPQRRRRVFVIGYLGDWRPPAAVLFESASLSWSASPREEAWQGVAGTLKACAGKSGTPNGAEEAYSLVAMTLKAAGQLRGLDHETLVAGTLKAYSGRNQVEETYLPADEYDAVRRFTPRECERLQGFPDDYTLIQFRGRPAADTARRRALGNSMAVPVMRWIGERIDLVESLWAA